MRDETKDGHCAFQPIIELLGKRHSLEILYALTTRNPMRFGELRSFTKINPRTLTDRLRELQVADIVQRIGYNEIPPRVEYHLTSKGKGLVEFFQALEKWYTKYGRK